MPWPDDETGAIDSEPVPPSNDPSAPAGTVYAGRYAIRREIGRGGMGRVLLARDLRLSRDVAVKVLVPGPHDAKQLRRFEQEARAAGSLNHPNIVDVHDVGEHEGEPYIVTEFLEGQTLREMHRGGPLAADLARDFAVQLAQGLVAAHEHGIVHRDLKPANLFITDDGRLKILDFGIAQLPSENTAAMTRSMETGSPLGTISYMSPEQVHGRTVDARSDLFAFGSVLHEMLSGAPPFERNNPLETAHAILTEAPAPLPATAPSSLVRVVDRCLRKDPEERFASARELVAALGAPRTTVAARLRRRTTVIAAAMLASAVAGLIAIRILRYPPSPANRFTVAAADFVNETREPELDGLSGMLITGLEQSRRLSVLTRSRMFDVLKQIGHADAERIDETLGREICKHLGVDALVLANIRRFGELYSIDVKLLDPVKNEYLFAGKQQGKGKESIPGMLDRLSDDLSANLTTKDSHFEPTHVAQTTTANLDAYQHFFLGEQMFSRNLDIAGAEREFRTALALDADFALARLGLSRVLAWSEHDRRVHRELKAALALLDRLPQRELCNARSELAWHEARTVEAIRMATECVARFSNDKTAIRNAAEFTFHTGDVDSAAHFFEKLHVLDPLDFSAVVHLIAIWNVREQQQRMIAIADEYLELSHSVGAYKLSAATLYATGHVDQAWQTLHEAQRLFPSSWQIASARVSLFILLGEPSNGEEELNLPLWAGALRRRFLVERKLDVVRGRYRRALAELDRDAEDAVREGDPWRAGQDLVWKAHILLDCLNDVRGSREQADKVRKVCPDCAIFTLYVEQGDVDRAALAVASYEAPTPDAASWVAAARDLEQGRVGSAISRYELLASQDAFWAPRIHFRLAQMYLRIDEPGKAIASLRRSSSRMPIISFDSGRGMGAADITPVVQRYLLLGRAYDRTGDVAAALEAYRWVLKMWSDADPDLKELAEVRSRVAELERPTAAVVPASARP